MEIDRDVSYERSGSQWIKTYAISAYKKNNKRFVQSTINEDTRKLYPSSATT